MAPPRKTGGVKRDTTSTKPASAPNPSSMATRMKPLRVVPTTSFVHSKTMANGQPRPKSRRGK